MLDGVARRTRVVPDPGLSAALGTPVWFKCEHEQHTGSFKLRGAYHRVATADPAARARGVVAASAGNHAQGVAFAAATFGVPATIFVPAGANPVKVARTRRWGARVEEVPGGVEAALAAAADFAARGGRLLVHPFDDLAVVAGQGTIGLELLDQVPDLGTVLVGVGGGGLVSGVAAALRARRPGVRVIGVQSVLAPAFAASLRAGRRLTAVVGADLPGAAARGRGVPTIPGSRLSGRPVLPRPAARPRTIADGMAVSEPGALTFALATRLVDEVVTVDEAAFWEAMVLLRRAGLAVEPAGAAPVAALLRHGRLVQGPTVAILSGGNIDPGVASRVKSLAAVATDDVGELRTTA
ncbi:putative threonine dehydratase [Frankia alni ACN14a]|uniref:threonine ammonia-lyase n=1 Tax=Frankia alni (strain DSM 45986 / CECT 9034 / ACN14a) TaxID=326424 RepID=Q0RRK5_FRAAA|nr:putative threonine dehydratase [Frankia alni ACN14a]